jgi:hypothetical protein
MASVSVPANRLGGPAGCMIWESTKARLPDFVAALDLAAERGR